MFGYAASNCLQRVVLPPPDGAEITINNGVDCASPMLFNVLRLLAEFFQLGLERHHRARDDAVVRLRADGIDLAIDLLRQEIERAPDRFPGIAAIVELLEMALQTRQFLRDVRAVSEIDDFLQ